MWVASALVFTIPPKNFFFVIPPHPTAKKFFRARVARAKIFFSYPKVLGVQDWGVSS